MDYTLRKITQVIKHLVGKWHRGEVDDAEFQESLNNLDMKFREKLENIGYVRIEQKAYIKRLKAEKKRIDREIQAVTKNGEWLDWYCRCEMEQMGIRAFVGDFIRLAIAKSPTSAKVPINPDTRKPRWEAIDPRFVEETVTPKLKSQEAIEHFERTGEVPDGFTFITNREHLRIKMPHSDKSDEVED